MKAWKWIKKNWKPVIKGIVLIIAIIFGATLVSKIKKSKIGKVIKAKKFIADGKDDTIIHVSNGEKYISVKLPLNKKGKQLKAKDVEAVGYSKENTIIVEPKHEKIDFSNVSSIDNSALDSLGLSK